MELTYYMDQLHNIRDCVSDFKSTTPPQKKIKLKGERNDKHSLNQRSLVGLSPRAENKILDEDEASLSFLEKRRKQKYIKWNLFVSMFIN